MVARDPCRTDRPGSRDSAVWPEERDSARVKTRLHSRFNTVRDNSRVFVRPEPEHQPICLLKQIGRLLISSQIPRDLRLPVAHVRLGHDEVDRAGMPEAAVNEHSDLESGEHDVGGAADARQRSEVGPIPQAVAMENRPHGEFWPRVSRPDSDHVAAHLVTRGPRLVHGGRLDRLPSDSKSCGTLPRRWPVDNRRTTMAIKYRRCDGSTNRVPTAVHRAMVDDRTASSHLGHTDVQTRCSRQKRGPGQFP